VTRAVRWTGRFLVVAGLALWATWLGWRLTTPMLGVAGVAVFALELLSLAATVVLSAALWSAPRRSANPAEPSTGSGAGAAPLPETMRTVLGLSTGPRTDRFGPDDTGEVAWARQALGTVDPRRRGDRPGLRELAWAVVALDGMRRMVVVVALTLVLFSGRFPFEVPRWEMFAVLAGSQVVVSLGHVALSDGRIRPGARLRWSMASIGAGFGDGTSRTGLPIRWTATMGSMVALNVAVSLRGLSDRWTHGLGAMSHDERVVSMLAAAWFVAWGFVALRSLQQPTLGFYGATRRLEETSTRRLALGATLAVAAIGLVAGLLPAGVPA